MTDASDPVAKGELPAKDDELGELHNTVVDAASLSGGLWLSYVFVFFYLGIAAGGVTHHDLLFEDPVKLPFLNVDLPLLGFFVLGPLLFLIVHAYVLLHLVMLAGKVGAFDKRLVLHVRNEHRQESLRRQLPSNIFVQLLAGPSELRTGIVGLMLRLIAWISLAVGPVLLLVFFQLQFLPYHSEVITTWHRCAVVIDLALLWILWPPIVRGKPFVISHYFLRRKTCSRLAPAVLVSLVPILLVFAIATFPGESLNSLVPSIRFFPVKDAKGNWRATSLHGLLIEGEVNRVTRKPTSLWPNVLVLPGIDIQRLNKSDGDHKTAGQPEILSLRGRYLEGAILIDSKFRDVDFTGAHLDRALLTAADLRGAHFECGQLTIFGEVTCAELRHANLGASDLRGARLSGALLHGANLFGAKLDGAYLVGAELQGASLKNAELRGAFLGGAHLLGVSLDGAKLQTALLNGAELQGAFLDNAEVEGADFGFIFAWRADPRTMKSDGTTFLNTITEPKYLCGKTICDLSSELYESLNRLVGERSGFGFRPIGNLDPRNAVAEEQEIAAAWKTLDLASRPIDETRLFAVLRTTGCNTPYAITTIARSLGTRFKTGSSKPAELAAVFLDEAHCPAAREISDVDKAALRRLNESAPVTTAPSGTRR
jgi:uncharacterized protein YjbI with pentapeptide repeats